MTETIFRFQELTTGEVVEDLPVKCEELPRNMSADADARMTLQLGDKELNQLDYKKATTPGKMGVFCLEDNQPIWGGMVWARDYDRATRVLQIYCSTIESYYRSRYISKEITVSQEDQFAMLIFLLTGIWAVGSSWNVLQPPDYFATSIEKPTIRSMWIKDFDGTQLAIADCMASIVYPYSADVDGVSWNALVSSGVLRDRTWDPGKNIYDAVTELVGVSNGMEWTLDPAILGPHGSNPAGGDLGWYLRLGAPRLGRTYDVSGFNWTASPFYSEEEQDAAPDDNVETYKYTEDARKSANHALAIGSEVNGKVLVSDLADLRSIEDNYPVLEQSVAFSDVTFQGTLDSHAHGILESSPLPNRVTVWEVYPDRDPQFGSYILGDEGYFQASDDLDPMQSDGTPGKNSIERIVGWIYRPEQTGQRRTMTLITNPTVQAQATYPPALSRRMDDIRRQLKGLSSTSKAPQTNAAVHINNPLGVLLPLAPASAVSGTPAYGAEVVIANIIFYKQADFLTMSTICWETTPVDFDVTAEAHYFLRSGEDESLLMSDPRTGPPDEWGRYFYVGSSLSNSLAAAANYRFSLAGWAYGDLVNVELIAIMKHYSTGTPTQDRWVRVLYASQGP